MLTHKLIILSLQCFDLNIIYLPHTQSHTRECECTYEYKSITFISSLIEISRMSTEDHQRLFLNFDF